MATPNLTTGAAGDASASAAGTYLLVWNGSTWIPMLGDSTGALSVGSGVVTGNVAAGAADSGNPVKVGGKYNATKPTLTDGLRGDLQLGTRGSALVTLMQTDGTNAITAAATLDAAAGSLLLPTATGHYNGASWDRLRSNEQAILLASAARTATTNSPDQTNFNGRGCHVSIDVTVEGAATLAIKIQGKHSIGGTYYDIADFGVVYTAATDAPGAKTISLYPGNLSADHVGVGAGVSGTSAKAGVLPRVWRAVVTHADATTTTYSLAAVTIV